MSFKDISHLLAKRANADALEAVQGLPPEETLGATDIVSMAEAIQELQRATGGAQETLPVIRVPAMEMAFLVPDMVAQAGGKYISLMSALIGGEGAPVLMLNTPADYTGEVSHNGRTLQVSNDATAIWGFLQQSEMAAHIDSLESIRTVLEANAEVTLRVVAGGSGEAPEIMEFRTDVVKENGKYVVSYSRDDYSMRLHFDFTGGSPRVMVSFWKYACTDGLPVVRMPLRAVVKGDRLYLQGNIKGMLDAGLKPVLFRKIRKTMYYQTNGGDNRHHVKRMGWNRMGTEEMVRISEDGLVRARKSGHGTEGDFEWQETFSDTAETFVHKDKPTSTKAMWGRTARKIDGRCVLPYAIAFVSPDYNYVEGDTKPFDWSLLRTDLARFRVMQKTVVGPNKVKSHYWGFAAE